MMNAVLFPAISEFESSSNPGVPVPPPGSLLSASDADMLVGLAAYHVRYGKPYDALALLQLVRRCSPEDHRAIRLMAEALLQSGDADGAEHLLGELERLENPQGRSARTYLLRAFVDLAKRRVSAARTAFQNSIAAAAGAFAR